MSNWKQASRVEWIDSVKGILIFLVVFGHVVGPGAYLAPSGVAVSFQAIHDYIYLFHMPAFFFVAGLLWRKTDEEIPFGQFLKKKALRLLVPYFIVGIISASIFCLTNGGNVPNVTFYHERVSLKWAIPFLALLHGGRWPNGLGFTANSVLWFLPCMFALLITWRLILDMRMRWMPKSQHQTFDFVVWLIMLVLAYVVKYTGVAYWPLGIHKVPFYLLFFIFAKNVPKPWFDEVLYARPCICFIGALASGIIVQLGSLPILWQCRHLILALKLVCAFAGTFMVIFIALLMQKQFVLHRIVAFMGCSSMVIMLLHKFPVIAMQFHIGLVAHSYSEVITGVLASVVITFMAIICCLAVGWFLSRYGLGWIVGHITRPKTNIAIHT